MAALQPSIDNFIAQNTGKGSFVRAAFATSNGSKTAALTTAGGITTFRFPCPIAVPSFGTGVTGLILTEAATLVAGGAGVVGLFLEVSLGSINMSTGTFTAGSTMPSRRIVGSDTALQLAAPLVVLVATVAVTATTPTITVTYTDQGGTSGNTATLVFPSNPTLHSAFVVNPHLASGDTGVQAVTAMTKSAGSAGTVTAYGLYPVHLSSSGTGPTNIAPDFWSSPIPKLSLQTSDNLTAYMFGSTASSTFALITVSGVADT